MTGEILHFINDVAAGKHLTLEQSSRAFQIMMTGGATPAQMAALLTALHIKGETAPEIAGAALALRAKMETVASPPGTIDVCGTGGDGRGTFNVSTAVALTVAGAGQPVAKHGNKSVSSRSGSADVFGSLGVNVQMSAAQAQRSLAEARIAFLFAPLYHKAMRHVAPVRQELGIRTLFNLIGPLVNPARPRLQLMGVYHPELVRPMAEVLFATDSQRAWVVHGSDGLDELTLTGPSMVAELKDGAIRFFEVTPQDAGLEACAPEQLAGGSPEYNARELSLLLAGKRSAYRDIVLLNAAAALVIAEKAGDLKEGAMLAAQAIDEGGARAALTRLVQYSNEAVT